VARDGFDHPRRLYESRVLPTELARPFYSLENWLAGQDSNLRMA
jgi:hypothetical protein